MIPKNEIKHDKYINEIEMLRTARQQRMIQNPLGWFALVGLFPLKPGANTLGSTSESEICIPQLNAAKIGILILDSGRVSLHNATADTATVNGKPPHENPLRMDVDGNPDLIENGTIAMRVINRGNRFFLRVWDRESPMVRNFKGLKFFDVDPAYRIIAQYIPFDPPLLLKKLDVIGTEYEQPYIGTANFTTGGKECSLIAEEDEDQLLFCFTDETRRDSTYPGGRYLLTARPVQGKVILDFNLSINWPCAYTPFATCPVPPVQNRLGVRIEAGEKRFHDDLEVY